MIISRTPFRISFFGGGTDFPEFYSEHGGAVLATTIDKYCYITIHRLAPFFKYRFKASYARTETVQDPAQFEHPLIRECLLFADVREGLEIAHVSDLPGRTGLGTSSSFTVGLLHALHAYRHAPVTPEQLAREAITIERECVGDPGGHQDQYAAAYGGFVRMDFSGSQQVVVRDLQLPDARMRALQQHLLMFYTGTEQAADHILTEQRARAKQNVCALRRMTELVNQAERAIQSDRLAEFGALLHETWMLKKGLSSGISNGGIDDAYAAARAAGALGGKLLGAGGRGFLLLFAEPSRHDAIRARLTALREAAFSMPAEGSRIIFASQE